MAPKPADDFPDTQLSLIHRIRRGLDNDRSEALACFFDDYYPALLGYLINSRGVDPATAEELVQDFIVQKVVTDRVLHLADRQGKFRKQLITCVKNHFLMSIRRTKRRKEVSVELQSDLDDQTDLSDSDEDDFGLLNETCDQAVVLGALRRMREEFAHWELFRDRVLTAPAKSLDELCELYHCETKKQASNRVTNGQRCLNRFLREQLAHFRSLSENPEDVQQDIESLRRHLADPQRLADVMHLLDGSDPPQTVWPFATGHSITNEEILFVDESSDSVWDDEDVTAMMNDILHSSLTSYLESTSTTEVLSQENATTVDLVIHSQDGSEIQLQQIRSLKQFFNARGRDQQSGFPARMDVAFTFSLIAKYVSLGGQLEQITSMEAPVLIDRLEMLKNKHWIPAELLEVNRQAIGILLR